MATRCFGGPTRAITTSGELTASKRDIATYKNLRSFAAHPEQPAINGFTISRCAEGGVLTSAGSYALLDSAARGKAYTNPMLEGAGPQALNQAWGASMQTQSYGLSASAPPVTGYPGPPGDCAPEKCPWGVSGAYPGYVIDGPGDQVEGCVPPPGAKRTDPWQASARVGFSGYDAYWAAVNAQPLQGMRFRAPTRLTTQTPSGNYAPRPPGGPASLHPQFCQGKGAIN